MNEQRFQEDHLPSHIREHANDINNDSTQRTNLQNAKGLTHTMLSTDLVWDIISEEITAFSFLIVNDKGLLLHSNKGAASMLGIVEEAINSPVLDKLLRTNSFNSWMLQMTESINSETEFLLSYIETHLYLSWQGYIQDNSGRNVKASLKVRGMFDNSPQLLGMVLIIQPIERPKDSSNVPFLEESYRTLMQNFPSGAVFLFDDQMCYFFIEGKDVEQMGFSKEEMEHKNIYEVFEKPLVELVEKEYQAALKGEHLVRERMFNGKWFRNHILPVKNEAGEILCGMVVAQNIHEWKQKSARVTY